jgi:N-acetyl-anhydromuramyl-L-alanine amidase AmpD
METLRIGSRGDSVRSLQILLNNHGFEGSPDGIFGNGTEDNVIAFQRKNNLSADGIVGKTTWAALLKDKETKRIDDTKYVLTTKKFFAEPILKKNIVLHHTNGWTVRKGTEDRPSMNHFNWWKSTDGHVSTAFSIDHKGNIYQHFDPQYWAYHLGIGGSKKFLDKQSIGIELVNEGHMVKKDDKYYWVLGDNKDGLVPYNRPQYEPFHLKNEWRGYNYFAPYPKEQFDSTLWLVKYLCNKYNISKNIVDDHDFHEEILSGAFEGIYNHANVRKYPDPRGRNKWDLSPAFDLKDFRNKLSE